MTDKTIRLFIAAALSPALAEYFVAQTTRFAVEDWRVVPATNLHLTLMFIGNVQLKKLGEIRQKMPAIVARHHSFTLQFEQIETGPKATNLRLIWARFQKSTAFGNLGQDMQRELAPEVSLPKQQIPHITLARRRKDALQMQPFPEITAANPLTLPVSEIGIWQSVLGQPHPAYSALETFPLLPPTHR